MTFRSIYIILVGWLAACALPLHAQQQPDCEEKLEEARDMLKKGLIYRIEPFLKDCLKDKTLSRPIRRDILALVIEVQLYTNQEQKARRNYEILQDIDPFFNFPQVGEIPELQYLTGAYKTSPLSTFYLFGGLFVNNWPRISERYSFDDVVTVNQNFDRRPEDPFGYLIGGSYGLSALNNHIDLVLEYTFITRSYRYSANMENAKDRNGVRQAAELSIRERNSWSQVAVTAQRYFVKRADMYRKRFLPYVSAGIGFSFLHPNGSRFNLPTIEFANGLIEQEEKIDIGDLRSRTNLSFVAALGVRYHFKRSFISVETRYSSMYRNIVNGDNRFSNPTLSQKFNYVDNDFKIRDLSVTLGAGFFLFQTKKEE